MYHGFKLIYEKEIHEANSIGRMFHHIKTGAELYYMQNDDKNKVFAITFRTPPHDDSGIPHILEHSVLNGSEKFPVKEPFMELIKGSLNTFINAITFSDKTMYPVASTNDKDFINLMNVYLDAVFHPMLHHSPEILMQEGWHYEIENGELIYKGVVYNEMQGAFSVPERILNSKIQKVLFPDTPYFYESGGIPSEIINLTQDEFEAFHRKYYHPSNSKIFIYGDGDILEHLQFINEEYLRDFDEMEVDSQIPMQSAFDAPKQVEIEYPISANEDDADKTYHSLNFVVGNSIDPEHYLAFSILKHLLLGSPGAPLQKALTDAQLGKDVLSGYQSDTLQPVFTVGLKDSNLEKREEFKTVVFDTLRKLVDEGIDKRLIEASINIREFHLREADFRGFPKGLFFAIIGLNSWLYDEEPELHWEYEPILEKIRAALETNYFEELIEEYLLNNDHYCSLTLIPKKGLAEENAQRVKGELKAYQESLTEEQLQDIMAKNARLTERQETPDSPEDVEKIPLLSLCDIKHEIEDVPTEEREEMGVKVLNHPIFTNEIVYLNLYFDTSAVPQTLLPYLALLTDILGDVSTEKTDYSDISNEVNIHTGGISFSHNLYTDDKNYDQFFPKLKIKSKALTPKVPKLFEVLAEITTQTKFDEDKRLKEIIQQLRSSYTSSIMSGGFESARLGSYILPVGKYNELINGISYFKFLDDLEKNFDQRVDELKENLKRISQLVFNKNNLLTSVTITEDEYDIFRDNFGILIDSLAAEKNAPVGYDFALSKDNEGLMIPSNVQFVAKGYNYRKLGYDYSGKILVLSNILSLNYLWTKLRVQGGAYGGGAKFSRNGTAFFTSYRDPNLVDTLKNFDGVVEYLRQFSMDRREMQKAIIGTISSLDNPLTPSMKGEQATNYYIRNITAEDKLQEREEVLSVTEADIVQFAEMVEDVIRQDCFCVLGNEGKLRENGETFGELVSVFE